MHGFVACSLSCGSCLAQPFPMNGSVTGRGAAVNINMQYHFKPSDYLCIVILELWPGPGFWIPDTMCHDSANILMVCKPGLQRTGHCPI